MKLFGKKKARTDMPKGLDDPLNAIPGTNVEITYTEAMEASLIIGVGSGKVVGGKKIANTILEKQYGMCALCNNPDERKTWERYIRKPVANLIK